MKLPDDILHDIFSLFATQVVLPLQKKPFALVLSHVCSSWRCVALNTPTLWNNVAINFRPAKEDDIHAWLSYASRSLVSISVPYFLSNSDLKKVIHSIILRYRLKRLMVYIRFNQLEIFLSEAKNETLEELKLQSMNISTQNFVPLYPLDSCSFPSLTSFKLKSPGHPLDIQRFHHIPWSRLHYLQLDMSIHLTSLLQHLKQSLELKFLQVAVLDDVGHHLPSEDILLPHLSHLGIRVKGPGYHDPCNVIRHLIHPRLQTLHLQATEIRWNWELFSTLSRQSHFNSLRKLQISGDVDPAIPIDLLLKDMPQLHELQFPQFARVNEHTLDGLLTGEIGPSLTHIGRLYYGSNPEELLTVVEERLRATNRNRQDMAPTRHVLVQYSPFRIPLRDRASALRKQGIVLTLILTNTSGSTSTETRCFHNLGLKTLDTSHAITDVFHGVIPVERLIVHYETEIHDS
ncbi:hypothetical protein AMATHDRAFT_69292 [Amanita thiersii Skay4041]|uniref:F-box domain-containing protein n=1 Tax=Amanita thiersii Skay4041 TaxID=703135 RepID=A0A2A9NG89_9AGAR|nr:hypothetical protein AMATHDRAFT_69292 [Amanita thiersii Skay4041]